MPSSGSPVRKVALADVSPNRRRGGDIRVLLGPQTAGATSGFFGGLTLAPGEFVAVHYAPDTGELLDAPAATPGRAAAAAHWSRAVPRGSGGRSSSRWPRREPTC